MRMLDLLLDVDGSIAKSLTGHGAARKTYTVSMYMK